MTLIRIEFNKINGFILSLLSISDKDLFGLHFSNDFFILNVAFINIINYDRNTK